MRILILSAFEQELACFLQQFKEIKKATVARKCCFKTQWQNHEITISFTGIGTTATAGTVTAFCQELCPDLIIFAGVAGGLDSNLKIGDLIVGSKIIDIDLFNLEHILKDTPYRACLKDPHLQTNFDPIYNLDPRFAEIVSNLSIPRLTLGNIGTSNVFPAPKSLLEEIRALNCSAIEMEGAGICKIAKDYEIPCLVVRAISNLLNTHGDDLGTPDNAIEVCAIRLAAFLNFLLKDLFIFKPAVELNQKKRIEQLIKKYELLPHPEGGWYRQTFRSQDIVKPKGLASDRYKGQDRNAGTSILYLLGEGDFSAWHTVCSDETWNFHVGDPLLLRVINPITGDLREVHMGLSKGSLQSTVRAGEIFCAETTGQYSLVGCSVTPGFTFEDFHLINMEEFKERFPQHSSLNRFVCQNLTISYTPSHVFN